MSLKSEGLEIHQATSEIFRERVLTPEALRFLRLLHEHFDARRQELLARRKEQQTFLDTGGTLRFLDETRAVREGAWTVAKAPADLDDRRVEITGPTDAKMLINALNSGAKVFMADFEDSLSPTWLNLLQGQVNLQDAIRKTLRFRSEEGREYSLRSDAPLATLVVRPRGWHLNEKNVSCQGRQVSGSLFDFGLYFFHNAHARIERGSAPYFYLPKMESHLEARLWNDVFNFSQDHLSIPRGTIRATCLIETIPAAFEMEEFLFELKDHAAGLNAGRWDYIFSMIKKFAQHPDKILPDRSQVTMQVPFMRNYAQLLVRTCHKRGAHAIGGMAAFIPSRKDADVNRRAMQKVTEDKNLEVKTGFDGTWVAHPDLVAVAKQVFDDTLGARLHQKDVLRADVTPNAEALLDVRIEGGQITEEGVRYNIRVAIQYMDGWLKGLGAIALYNLMEDAATAEISRAQLWQWIRHKARLNDGRVMDAALYRTLRDEELQRLGGQGSYKRATDLLDAMVLAQDCGDFLTLPAYALLDARQL